MQETAYCAIENEIPLPNIEVVSTLLLGVHESYTVEVRKYKYQTPHTVSLLLPFLV